MSTNVTCGHCEGKGVCYRGDDSNGVNSCDTCRKDAGRDSYNFHSRGFVVKCSICQGTGWVNLS